VDITEVVSRAIQAQIALIDKSSRKLINSLSFRRNWNN